MKPKPGVTAGHPALVRAVAKMTHLHGQTCLALIVTATTFTTGAQQMATAKPGIRDGGALRTSLVEGSLQPRLAVIVAVAAAIPRATIYTSALTCQVGKMWRRTLATCTQSVLTALSEVVMALAGTQNGALLRPLLPIASQQLWPAAPAVVAAEPQLNTLAHQEQEGEQPRPLQMPALGELVHQLVPTASTRPVESA